MSQATPAADDPRNPTAFALPGEATSPRLLLSSATLGLGALVFLLGANWMNEWLFGPFALHATPLAGSEGGGGINLVC